MKTWRSTVFEMGGTGVVETALLTMGRLAGRGGKKNRKKGDV